MQEHEFYAMCEKVNVPASLENYNSGNGEGMWALGTQEFIDDYKNDVSGTRHIVKLMNKSVYYPELAHGAEVVVEMRGNNRPVVVYSQLEDMVCVW